VRSGRIELSCMNCEYLTLMGERVRVDENRYHHLNHYSIFGGGYRGGAVRIMKSLCSKYGG